MFQNRQARILGPHITHPAPWLPHARFPRILPDIPEPPKARILPNAVKIPL